MGGNASPLIADLVLCSMEMKFVLNRRNLNIALQLRFTLRYLDDGINLNCGDFSEVTNSIYPDSLPFDVTSTANNTAANFLDISLQIQNQGELEIKVYNKTDIFNFNVIKYGSYNSNIHTKVGFQVYFSENLRYLRITNQLSEFEMRSREIFLQFLKNGFPREGLLLQFHKFICKYSNLGFKFKLYQPKDWDHSYQRIFCN